VAEAALPSKTRSFLTAVVTSQVFRQSLITILSVSFFACYIYPLALLAYCAPTSC